MSFVIPAISFPENVPPLVAIPQSHLTIRYINKLSKYTGLTVILIYIIAKLILQPTFQLSLDRRLEFHHYVYSKLQALKNKLKKMVKNPPGIRVAYNGKLMIDRSVETEEENEKSRNPNDIYKYSFTEANGKEVRFNEQAKNEFVKLSEKAETSTDKLNDRLEILKNNFKRLDVTEYKKWDGSGYNSGHGEMNALQLQVKQLKNYLDIVTSEHPREMLFKKPVSHIQVGKNLKGEFKHNYLDILNDQFDDIKDIIKQKQSSIY